MTDQHLAAVIVLAAGEGTRMKSAVPKVLHPIAGRSLLEHAIRAAEQLDPEHLAVVVRHKRELVAAHIAQVAPTAVVADQDEVKGTGRAAECGLEMLPADLTGTVVVTYGDVPMLTTETLDALCKAHAEGGNAVTVMTAHVPDPHGYGRIVRDADGQVAAIVEQKDATEEQRAITEINSGIYAFDGALLREALAQVGTDNAQGEKYLTDVLAIARGLGRTVAAFATDDLWQTEGVNDRIQLSRMGAELNRRLCEQWMRAGVTIIDPASTWIDSDVSIGADTTIHPDTQLRGATTIGADTVIGPDVTLIDSEVGDGARVWRTDGEAVEVGPGAKVGPYVHLRPNTTVGEGAVVEGFVVTIDTDIEPGTRVGSFTALSHSHAAQEDPNA
ncbi:MAG: bifunctional UDP-N-acetylglucosamine diphosphorylase/glucosamine-1-phosphate N-acetyltransferase GlmU [Dermatophilus congolensis]|nr:bifunctional UDP-N-acetylglucosamine diphosphorylase/glucosamine-1-phosphate N-acetyltransferase GlmU [Dermatophilus congolensis]